MDREDQAKGEKSGELHGFRREQMEGGICRAVDTAGAPGWAKTQRGSDEHGKPAGDTNVGVANTRTVSEL